MTESAVSESIVFVIDDDTSVRAAVKELLESVGLRVIVFGSAAEFLESTIPDAPCCMVLDVRMPETSGLKLQEELLKAEVQVPIVFISGHADVAMAVRAMKAGAVDFLAKPFSTQDLLDKILDFSSALTDQSHNNDIGAGIARHHAEQDALSHAGTGKKAHALAAPHRKQGIYRTHPYIKDLVDRFPVERIDGRTCERSRTFHL